MCICVYIHVHVRVYIYIFYLTWSCLISELKVLLPFFSLDLKLMEVLHVTDLVCELDNQ